MSLVRWYAAHTGARMEKAAATGLERSGFYVFLPFRREKVRRVVRGGRRRLTIVERVLTPRYVFVAMRGRPQESFEAIESVPGVAAVVRTRFEKTPLTIPNPVMDAFMAVADGDGFAMSWRDPTAFAETADPAVAFDGRPGDRLQLVDEAPYWGLVTTLASAADLDRTDRIAIWLDLLGGKRKVSVPLSAVAEIIR